MPPGRPGESRSRRIQPHLPKTDGAAGAGRIARCDSFGTRRDPARSGRDDRRGGARGRACRRGGRAPAWAGRQRDRSRAAYEPRPRDPGGIGDRGGRDGGAIGGQPGIRSGDRRARRQGYDRRGRDLRAHGGRGGDRGKQQRRGGRARAQLARRGARSNSIARRDDRDWRIVSIARRDGQKRRDNPRSRDDQPDASGGLLRMRSVRKRPSC